MTDGVIQSHSTRALTLANLGYSGATNANYITNNNQLTNGAGYTTCTGTGVGNITCISTASGLDGAGSSGTVTISLDLSELTDMTGSVCTTQDELILLDNGAERRKRFSEIFGSNAYSNTTIPTNNNQLTNGAGYTTCTGDITQVVAGTCLTGGGTSGCVTINHSDTSSQSSVNNSGGTVIQDVTLDGYGHVTALGSYNLDGRYYTEGEVDSLLSCKSPTAGSTSFTTAGNLTVDKLNMRDMGDCVTFYGNDDAHHSISSRDKAFCPADDLRINSYGAVYINLDSNNNNTTGADFCIGRHGATSTISSNLFHIDGESGSGCFSGNLTVGSGGITLNGTGRIQGIDTVSATTDATNKTYVDTCLATKQASGTYNTIIGTDSDINTSGCQVVDQLVMTDGVITSHSTRNITLANLGYTGATNANYITNNNQLTNGSGYTTCTGNVVTSGSTFTGSITLNDNVCVKIGSSADLSLFHNGTSSYIDNDKNHLCIRNNVDGDDGGNIYIMPHDNETGIVIHDDSAVCLYSDNAVKFCTQSFGTKTQGTHCSSYDMKAPIGCFCTMGIGGQSRQSSYALVAGNCGSCCGGGSAKFCGTVQVCGSFSKSSGCFDIAHPLPALSATKRLSHSFVESPQADNIYSGVVQLTGGSATVNVDVIHGMTSGTLTALNRCFRTFTTNETNWDPVRGSITDNTLTIESCVADSTATVSWMVLGERHDPHMREIPTTDDEGRARVEYTPPSDIYSDGDWEEL